MSNEHGGRYTAVAILLHWAIALAIIADLVTGIWMHEAIDVPETRAHAVSVYQLHKSLGLTILLLSLLRLGWRLLHPVPPLPVSMPAWEKLAAKVTHWAFYGLMIAVPLSGWLYASAQWRGTTQLTVPTLWFGLFEVPHLFGLAEAAAATRQQLAGIAVQVHAVLAISTMFLLLIHVAAALKHQIVNRDVVLSHMLPIFGRRDAPRLPGDGQRSVVLWSGSLVILCAISAFAWAATRTPHAATTEVIAAAATIADLPGSGWSIDPGSEIAFSGEHAGTPFKGRFSRWRANIQFDPANLTAASILVEVETGSASDGDPLHDGTLPEKEWFDVATHPLGIYRSTSVVQTGGGQYQINGTLTLKGKDLPVAPLSLALQGNQLTITGSATVSRREANLGMESDPTAGWVSADIPIAVKVTARKAGGK